jgi:hypothetical protein
MARLRRADVPCECPLIGVDRKWLADRQNDAIDPQRKSFHWRAVPAMSQNMGRKAYIALTAPR